MKIRSTHISNKLISPTVPQHRCRDLGNGFKRPANWNSDARIWHIITSSSCNYRWEHRTFCEPPPPFQVFSASETRLKAQRSYTLNHPCDIIIVMPAHTRLWNAHCAPLSVNLMHTPAWVIASKLNPLKTMNFTHYVATLCYSLVRGRRIESDSDPKPNRVNELWDQRFLEHQFESLEEEEE